MVRCVGEELRQAVRTRDEFVSGLHTPRFRTQVHERWHDACACTQVELFGGEGGKKKETKPENHHRLPVLLGTSRPPHSTMSTATTAPAATKDESQPVKKGGPTVLRSIIAGSTAGALEIGELGRPDSLTTQ